MSIEVFYKRKFDKKERNMFNHQVIISIKLYYINKIILIYSIVININQNHFQSIVQTTTRKQIYSFVFFLFIKTNRFRLN